MSEPRTEAGKRLLAAIQSGVAGLWAHDDGPGDPSPIRAAIAGIEREAAFQMGVARDAVASELRLSRATPPALDRETIRSALKGARGLAFDEGETDLDAELKRAIDLLDGLT